MTVEVTATELDNHTVTIPENTTPTPTTSGFTYTEGTPQFNTTPASATLLVRSLQAPTGSKSFNPSPSYVGRTTLLTINLNNPNTGAGQTMPLTSFEDKLPVGMKIASPAGAAVTCTGTGANNGTVSTGTDGTDSRDYVRLTGGTIGAGGSCQVTVSVVVPELDPVTATTQNFVNTLAAGAIGNTRKLNSPGFSQTLKVDAPVALSKSFSPATIPVAATSSMTITVTNNGGDALTGTNFVDTFPPDMRVAGAGTVSCTSGTNGTVTTGTTGTPHTVSLTGATVAANGGTCTIVVPVTAVSEGAHTNALPANAVKNDQGVGSPAVSTPLQAYAQLQVSKTVAPSNVAPGQWATFTLQVRNYASEAVTNARLSDALPLIGAQQMVVDASQAPSGCSMTFTGTGTNSLTGTGGTIPAASGTNYGACTVTFRALVPAGAATGNVFINTLPTDATPGLSAVSGVGATSSSPIRNTNTATANVTVVDAVNLAKSFLPTSIAAGQTSRLTITVYNRSVSPMSAITFTDNLPAGLTLAANPAASTTCTGGTLTAVPGDNKITLSNAGLDVRPLPPSTAQEASCTVSALVTGTTPQATAYTNTIRPADFTSSVGTFVGNKTADLTITAGLSATKTFLPTSTAAGGVVRATVRVTNQSNGALTNVSINDTGLAGGLTVANPANAATSCSGSTVITANPGATSVRLDGAVLSAAASCDLSFDVLAAGAGPWSNTIPAGNITSAEGPTNSQPVSANLTLQSAHLAINKGFNPLIVTGNEPSLLTINVVNSGSVEIDNVSFTDVFPPGIQVYSTPNTQTTCTGGTVAATPGAGQVALTGAKLPAGGACVVTLRVTSVAFLNLTNTIPAGAVSSRGGYTNATPTSATLTTLQGLGVSKGFEPAYVAPNTVSRLKIRLANTFNPNIVNPTVLTGLTFTDTLPSGLSFAPVPNAVTTCTGGQIHVNQGTQAVTLSGVTLTPGNVCDLEVNVVAGLGQYLNSIPAHGVTTDQGVTNNTPGESTLNVVEGPGISKTFAASPVKVGEPTQLIVTVTNNASVALTGVALTDNLPPHVAVANSPSTTTTCTGASVTAQAGASKVSLSGASLPANGSCTFRAMVVASEAATFKNTIGPNAITSNQGLTNGNPAEADLVVLTPPAVTKRFQPAQIDVFGGAGTNQISTLSIRLENNNTTAITLTAALVDALPGLPLPSTGRVSVAPTPNINGHVGSGETACTAASVTAVAGAQTVTYANGATIPAGGCTITVDVVASLMGNYLNVIDAGQLQTNAGLNPEPANATLGVDKPAAPTVNKAFSPATIDVNGTSVLTITLGNPNTTELTLTSAMVDTLPANVLATLPVVTGGSCPGSVTVTPGGGAGGRDTVAYAAGAKIPAAGCTITVSVTSAVAGSYTNTIPAGGLVTDEAGSNPTPANAGLVVRSPDEPTVLKAFSPTTINPGGVSKLTITLNNTNATAATLTEDLVDTLPAEVLVATPPAVGGTCVGVKEATAGGSTVTLKTGGAIPAKGSCTVEVNVTSTVPGGPYVNTIAANQLKTNLGNNGAPTTANLIVNPGQPPSVSKSFSPASIVAGQQSTLTIALGNANADPLTLTADMTDTLTNMTAVMPAVTTGTSCEATAVNVSAGAVTYRSGGVIPAGGCVIAVRVTSSTVIAAPGHPNTIATGALQTDGGNNTVPTTANLEVVSNDPANIASIAGKVYHDRNDSGVIDAGEEAIPGVEIRLMQNGSIVATTTTDADGRYSFTNLVPGTYTVVEVHPSGWIDGKDTAGTHGGTPGNDTISNVTLNGGDHATEYNFGERKPSTEFAAIPTLSQWGLLLLSLLLGAFALRQGAVQRRK